MISSASQIMREKLEEAKNLMHQITGALDSMPLFSALFDAVIDHNEIICENVKSKEQVRELLREAITYAVAKMRTDYTETEVQQSFGNWYRVMAIQVHEGKVVFSAYDPATGQQVFVPIDSVTAARQGTKEASMTNISDLAIE